MRENNTASNQLDGPTLMLLPQPDPRRHAHPGSAGQNEAESEADRKMEKSIAFMMQHLNQPLQVARLARIANVSPSHFFVLFKRQTGFSPIDYFIRLRMQHAGRLLISTALNVKEIAAELGYDDPFYFSRVFKAVHGLAPTDYRLKMQPMDGEERLLGLEKAGNLSPILVSDPHKTTMLKTKINIR